MGYLYEAIHSTKEEMLRRFQKKRTKVQPFIDIINNRWDGQLYRKLYAAGFWSNP
jgi:predicted component of type VI protein secretion system